MNDTRTCPTPCDADCKSVCHETHLPAWKRAHDPAGCPARGWDEIPPGERAQELRRALESTAEAVTVRC